MGLALQNRMTNQDRYFLTGLILLGILIRSFMWYWTETSFLGDMIHYVDVAKDIGAGNIQKAVGASIPPLYPLLIQTFYLFAQDYDISARLVNIIFGGLLIYPVFRMAYLVYGRQVAILAGCLTVSAGELVNYSIIGYAESTYLFFMTMAFYKVVKALRLRSNRELFFSGIFFGLTFLTKAQALAFIALSLFWALAVLSVENKKIVSRGIVGVFLLIIGYGIIVVPYPYLRQSQESTDGNLKSIVKSTYATHSSFPTLLTYEREYMSAYVLHKTQDGHYYMGGGEPDKSRKISDVLSTYLSVLWSQLSVGFPFIANHLFPLALLFFLMGLVKRDWDVRIEGYLMAIIIVNILVAALFLWNARTLDTLMPGVLIIGARGIFQSGSLLRVLTSEITPLSKGNFFNDRGKGWTLLIGGGILLFSLVWLLQQKPDYLYNARMKHQKEIAETLKQRFGNNVKIMSWGIGRPAIPYYMGVRLSRVYPIPIASMDRIMGYAKQEKVELLVFDTEEIFAKGPGRYPGIGELLKNKGTWPGLQLVMVSTRKPNAVSSYKVWQPDSGWITARPPGFHAIFAILVYKVL